jgi:hypothetical protein
VLETGGVDDVAEHLRGQWLELVGLAAGERVREVREELVGLRLPLALLQAPTTVTGS